MLDYTLGSFLRATYVSLKLMHSIFEGNNEVVVDGNHKGSQQTIKRHQVEILCHFNLKITASI